MSIALGVNFIGDDVAVIVYEIGLEIAERINWIAAGEEEG